MDAAGIDMQVLCPTTAGVKILAPDLAVRLAREANEILAERVAAHPDRFAELDRGVTELGFKGRLINGSTAL
jgi:predicted TIM-barrel fold metal-dependent hydrolase